MDPWVRGEHRPEVPTHRHRNWRVGCRIGHRPQRRTSGYAGPFSYCQGSRYDAIQLGDGHAYIDVYSISAGSGQLCAMTYDVADGRNSMGVTIRRTDWQTSWWDIGYYDRYAGAIYVGGMEGRCAEISGFIQHDDNSYYSNHPKESRGQLIWGAASVDQPGVL